MSVNDFKNIRLANLENFSKKEFLQLLEKELINCFNTAINNLPENYGLQKPWSLLNLIDSNLIDSYQLIYVNDRFWAGSGGIVRECLGESIYQGGFRGFATSKKISNGIGSYSLTHEYNTKQQIERAKYLNCTKFILSFNDHNEKLYKIHRDYHLPKIFGKNVFEDSIEQVKFNGVNQWLLTMSLK